MRSPAFLKISCRTLAFHIFKNLRLFDKKIVAGLYIYDNTTSTLLHYAVILDNSLVLRKKETKRKIEVLDQTHKMTCEECKIEKKREK